MTKAADLSKTGSLVNSSGQLSLTTGVTGILPVANGGTGTSTGVPLYFPFYKYSGSADNIDLVSGTYLPFFNYAGTSKNIALIT